MLHRRPAHGTRPRARLGPSTPLVALHPMGMAEDKQTEHQSTVPHGEVARHNHAPSCLTRHNPGASCELILVGPS